MQMDRKNKAHFSLRVTCTLPPARRGNPPERPAARRSAAQRGLDMQLRMQ